MGCKVVRTRRNPSTLSNCQSAKAAKITVCVLTPHLDTAAHSESGHRFPRNRKIPLYKATGSTQAKEVSQRWRRRETVEHPIQSAQSSRFTEDDGTEGAGPRQRQQLRSEVYLGRLSTFPSPRSLPLPQFHSYSRLGNQLIFLNH